MTRFRLKYTHSFRDRHGHMRTYFRRGREKAIPLPGSPGDAAFMAAYATALATEPPGKPEPISIGAAIAQPGTIEALVISYLRSDAWTSLAPTTKEVRRLHIEGFRTANGTKRVAGLTSVSITAMMERITPPYRRRDWFKSIRALLAFAVPAIIARNPTDGIKTPKVPKSTPHKLWTPEQIEQFRKRWPYGTPPRLVLEFALEAVSRRAEITRLGPQHIRAGGIRIERVHGSANVEIPMTPELAAAVAAMPAQGLVFVTNQYGRPHTPHSLGVAFRGWMTAAGLPRGIGMHGLKRSGMTRLAEAGATTHELMAVSGHRTLSMVERYTLEADKKKLAVSGIRKIKRRTRRVANRQQPEPANRENDE